MTSPSQPTSPSVDARNHLDFFTSNVDAWGAAEWFNRLAKAVREQDAAVLAKNDMAFETCKNVAASSAMRLVRDYEKQVRAALYAPRVEPVATAWRVCWVSLNTARTELFEDHAAASLKARETSGCVIPLYAVAPSQPDTGPWCQPNDCGKPSPRRFMIYFDDPDHGIMVFDDEGEARAAFEQKNTAWNCYLMASLPRTAQPDTGVREALQTIRRYTDENLGPSRSSLLNKIAQLADEALSALPPDAGSRK